MFGSLDQCFKTLSHIPRLLKNRAHRHLLAWFPDYFPSMCHPGDLLCHETNGLLRLEDMLPNVMMRGLDWCSENPYIALGVASSGLVGGGLYFYYRRCIITPTASLSPRSSVRATC